MTKSFCSIGDPVVSLKKATAPASVPPRWHPMTMTTWTTVGYGDLVPVGISRVFAVCEAFSQYLVMALLVAAFISLAQSMREDRQNRGSRSSE